MGNTWRNTPLANLAPSGKQEEATSSANPEATGRNQRLKRSSNERPIGKALAVVQPNGWSAVMGLVLQDCRPLKGPAAQNAQLSEGINFFCARFAGERKTY